jgi:hypothetical protein
MNRTLSTIIIWLSFPFLAIAGLLCWVANWIEGD